MKIQLTARKNLIIKKKIPIMKLQKNLIMNPMMKTKISMRKLIMKTKILMKNLVMKTKIPMKMKNLIINLIMKTKIPMKMKNLIINLIMKTKIPMKMKNLIMNLIMKKNQKLNITHGNVVREFVNVNTVIVAANMDGVEKVVLTVVRKEDANLTMVSVGEQLETLIKKYLKYFYIKKIFI